MASKKSRKGKTYNPKAKMRKFVKERAQRVSCMDGSMYDEMKYTGGPIKAAMPQKLKGDIMFSVADDIHHWSIMLLVFQEYDSKEWYDCWVLDNLDPASSNQLTNLLNDDLNKKRDGCNPKQLVSWGWYATPKKGADLHAAEKDIVNQFIEAGAFDREHCEYMHQQRVMAEKLEEMG